MACEVLSGCLPQQHRAQQRDHDVLPDDVHERAKADGGFEGVTSLIEDRANPRRGRRRLGAALPRPGNGALDSIGAAVLATG